MELIIETLEDVLAHITPDTGIIHSDHGDYSVVNYVFTVDETFATPLARECRGLKFDPEGRLIARPFHKFFNLGEKRPPEAEPWDQAHVVLDKLDGAMVHPAMVGGEMVFMTRMGRSAQARAAEAVASPGVLALCRDMLGAGFTPIFEFTGPDNRVVVAYGVPALTLLAIRHTRTGVYMAMHEIATVAARHDVYVVASLGSVEDPMRYWAQARALQGVEGHVIAFADGHRVKAKADAYVLRHKALAGLAHEKNVLAWIVEGALDDVLPMLSPENARIVQAYSDTLMARVAGLTAEVEGFVALNAGLARGEYAAKVKAGLPGLLHPVAFRALDGQPVRDGLMEVLSRACATDARVEAVRPLFGMVWAPPDT